MLQRVGRLGQAAGCEIGQEFASVIAMLAGVEDAWREPGAPRREAPHGSSLSELNSFLTYGTVSFIPVEVAMDDIRERSAIEPELGVPEVLDGMVDPSFFVAGRVPIARDASGGRFDLDLLPPAGGLRGQVLLVDYEASSITVFAPSLEDFLAYGISCLRWERGDGTSEPRLPLIEGRARSDTALRRWEDPAIEPIWQAIRNAASGVVLPEPFVVEVAAPSREARIDHLESRLGVRIPGQFRSFLRMASAATGVWVQPGSRGAYPIWFGILPDTFGWSRKLEVRISSGDVAIESSLADAEKFVPVFLGSAGWTVEHLHFYIVASEGRHKDEGKVLVLEQIDGKQDFLRPYCDSFLQFLENGLGYIRQGVQVRL